jgi:hypothetical protein
MMSFLGAIRGTWKGKALLLATAALAISAMVAVAATFTGDGTFVGTSGNDTFNLTTGDNSHEQ